MVFSSAVFLCLFLAVTLPAWFLTRRHIRLNNAVLTLASLFFYAWGEPRFVAVMAASIVANWLFGLWLDGRMRAGKSAKPVIWATCAFDLAVLGVFKYLTFVLRNLHALIPSVSVPAIALPIGISFFTFQAMSYVIDCARGRGKVRRDLLGVALYISFFPQLIAGPIVRYGTISQEIDSRAPGLSDFSLGVRRFLTGLCKKVLLANGLGLMVDKVFALPQGGVAFATAWMGAAAYIMQVYYDFSGYSDMAIGLGLMFGFHFQENFLYPFTCSSVGGFWKRWHISLGTWFRDYVYIPLGGSRAAPARVAFNIFVTWTLTGFWHGAEWTYLLWGMAFAALLILERFTPLGRRAEGSAAGHVYALLCITVVTVLIRSDSLARAGSFYGSMFFLNGCAFADSVTRVCLREFGPVFAAAAVLSFPVLPALKKRLPAPPAVWDFASAAALIALSCIAMTYIAGGSYNPFIYFNF